MLYQAVDAVHGNILFVNPANGNQARFMGKSTKVTLPSKAAVQVVSQDILYTTVKDVTSECSPCATDTVNNSVRIKATFIHGDTASLDAMRVEINRLLDKAIADYNFAKGFVPPASATLGE